VKPVAAAHEPRIARIAASVADPARSRMLCLLLSGDHATAGELAACASVTPATASGHLAKLLDAGLVVCEPRGRHRYYRLAGPDVAHALVALALVAERGQREKAWSHPARERLRLARCCYGHLAGQLGVRLFRTLVDADALTPTDDGFALSDKGWRWLAGMDMRAPAPNPRRRYAYACMDWSERQDHLGGQLSEAMLHHFTQRGWLRRAQGRAVEITPLGTRQWLPKLVQPNADLIG
jgi:DNA-binding transcriptional ArsR family regulator